MGESIERRLFEMRTRKEILADIRAHSNEWNYIGMYDAVRIQNELLFNIRNLAYQIRLLALRTVRKRKAD